jgi:hypothetical protein
VEHISCHEHSNEKSNSADNCLQVKSCLHHSHIENNNLVTLTNTNMFNPSPFASAENREIYHTVLAQRLKIETARKASERKKDLERIPKVEEAIQKVIN